MQQPPNHHLAQLNIARVRYDIDDPRMADFTDNLALVNGIAERSPGFVWRHVDESGNATDTRPYADPRIIVNFSVWETVAALERFVWQTVHKRFYGRRADWFEHLDGPSVVLWWVPAGHRPGVGEAVGRLDHLRQHGPGDHAFDWRHLRNCGRRRAARLRGRWRRPRRSRRRAGSTGFAARAGILAGAPHCLARSGAVMVVRPA